MKRPASRSNSFMRALACAAVVLVVPPAVVGTETAGPANGGSSVGYFCTTPSDLCRPGATPDGGNQGVCSYFPARQLWDFDFGP